MKDLWSLLEDNLDKKRVGIKEENDTKEMSCRDTFSLFVGSKSSGKTTLISYFLFPTKEEKPKPTVFLEYTFIRKITPPGGTKKSVANIWELAIEKKVPEIIRIPLTLERLTNFILLITVDLSNPGDEIRHLVEWLQLLKHQVDGLLTQMRQTSEGKQQVEMLLAEANARYSKIETDLKVCQPFPIPLVILATKYDVFQENVSIKRKGIGQALRYIAHIHGAYLITASTKDKQLMNHFRVLYHHLTFRTELTLPTNLDGANPLCITPGSDSLEGIGIPRGISRENFEASPLSTRMAQWIKACDEHFPPSNTDDKSLEDSESDPTKDFPEPMIDSAKAIKEEELKRYRVEAERKLKLMKTDTSKEKRSKDINGPTTNGSKKSTGIKP